MNHQVWRNNTDLRLKLLPVGKAMNENDIEDVIFVLKGILGAGAIEDIKTVDDVLDACIKCWGKDCMQELIRIFTACGRTRLVQIVLTKTKVVVVLHQNEIYNFQRLELTGDCYTNDYCSLLNEMTYHGDKGNWLKCKAIIDGLSRQETSYSKVCCGRLKLEYAIVEQFQGDLEYASLWIQSALGDADNVKEDGNKTMLYTYAYHYLSIICFLENRTVEAKEYMTRAKQYGFKLMDQEIEGHLKFAEGMLLMLQLRSSSKDNVTKRKQALECFYKASKCCKSAKRQTAGTEWCWIRSITLMAANLVKTDMMKSKVCIEDINKAEDYLHIVKKHRFTLNELPGQRESEILEIEACIAKRRGYFDDGLRYIEKSRQSYIEHGVSYDHCLVDVKDFEKNDTSSNVTKITTRKRDMVYAVCVLFVIITIFLHGDLQFITSVGLYLLFDEEYDIAVQ